MLYDKIPSALMLLNEQFGGYFNSFAEVDHAQEYIEITLGGAIYVFGGSYLHLTRAAFFISAKYFEKSLSSQYSNDSSEGLFVELLAVSVDSVAFSIISEGGGNICRYVFLENTLSYFTGGFRVISSKYLRIEDDGEYNRVGFDFGYSFDLLCEEYYVGNLDNHEIYNSLSISLIFMNIFGALGVIGKHYGIYGSEGGT